MLCRTRGDTFPCLFGSETWAAVEQSCFSWIYGFSGLRFCLVRVLLLAFDAVIWNCIIITVVRDRWPRGFFSQAGRGRRDDLSCVIQPMKNNHS